ncbi:hypothetical protein BD770DRAFT_388644 [Pilaira anomala]|nr:hypothetical protein BD770DRAFT_388644 [Pilaira anomala]
MSSFIHISITFDTTESSTIELDLLQSKLNWPTLVTLIESMHPMETPMTLYYKKQEDHTDECTSSLQNQDQLDQLLLMMRPDIKGLRFYTQSDQVTESVFVFPPPPPAVDDDADAFNRLAQFVNQHKSIIATSHRLASSIGYLATFIAQDTTEASSSSFDPEFQALEKLVERRMSKSTTTRRERKKKGCCEDDEVQDPPRELLFGRGGGRHGHFGGRGGGDFISGGGRHGRFGGRGGGDHFFGGGGRGGDGHFGGHFGGGGRKRHHHGHHHPFQGMNKDSSSEECMMNSFDQHGIFGKHGDFDACLPRRAFGNNHAKGFHGRSLGRHGGGRHHHRRGGRRCGKKKLGHSSSSEEESSGEEEAHAMMHRLKNQHRRGFKRHAANHFHFA